MEYDFYEFITKNPVGEDTIATLAGNMQKIALVFASTFFVIGLLWNYLKTIIQQTKFTADYTKILGGVGILILITFYQSIFGSIDTMCNRFNKMIYDNMQDGKKENIRLVFTQMVERNRENISENQKDYIVLNATNNHVTNMFLLDQVLQSDVIDKGDGKLILTEKKKEGFSVNDFAIVEKIGTLVNYIRELPRLGTLYTINLFLYVVKYALSCLIIATSYIFYIIGPLALVFSLLPIWEDKAENWFSTWITCKLSLTSFIIINTIYEAIADNIWNSIIVGGTWDQFSINSYETNIYLDLGLQLSGIIIYFLVFWITSQWVGNSQAGKVLSTGMQMATMAARAATGGSIPSPTSENTALDAAANIGGKTVEDKN